MEQAILMSILGTPEQGLSLKLWLFHFGYCGNLEPAETIISPSVPGNVETLRHELLSPKP